MTDITMPRLSDSMEEGTILSWLKQDGDAVVRGEELVEIETDKATMTYESPEAGTLTIVAGVGDTIAVGAPIARVGEAAASVPAAGEPAASSAAPAVSEPAASSAAPAVSESAASSAAPAVPTPASPEPAVVSASAVAPANGSAANGGGAAVAVRATPLARRIAAGHGVELAAIAGTGPHGRVTRADVAAAVGLTLPSPVPTPGAAPSAAPAPAPAPAAAPTAPIPEGATVQARTRIQDVIARRMVQSTTTVPHFQVETEAAMDAVVALRAQLKEAAERPPSLNDFVVKAAALALREFPLANGSYRDEGFLINEHVHVGVAVATEGALVVPTVTDADTRSLGSIAAEVRRLAGAVRDGTVTPAELEGATFTVSNLGMYGMTAITSVINAPQAAILGVGAARPTLARVDGEIVERQLMTLRLSCDHRILYGAEAAEFLARVRALLEQPLLLAVS